ncbi:DUF6049 family protein [Microbacterium paraoxydans]|uniref:DUF6049 family protein n=1 Tax=Microbacterium paraoxydans TaxID=199592 RepID=UPI001CFAB537|nr:DUF6049 family protein [Microbacterium paraoxydans]
MTAITPGTGLRARLHRLAGRTAVFAIAMGTCVLGVPGAAFAADQTPKDDDQAVELHVSAGMRGLVAPGSSTSALLTLDNGTDERLGSGQVEVELNRTPLADDAAVTSWLDEGEAAGEFTPIGVDETDPIDAGDSGTTTIFVPEDTLGDLAPGVYPLRAELTGATAGGEDAGAEVDTTATTVLVVADSQTTQIGVIVPLTATPEGGSLLTAEELAALTDTDGALTAQLDGLAGTTAVIAIDPSVIAAIRALGTAAPESAQDWLTRLDGLPNARFALQFGDADAAAQAQAGLPELLQPMTFAPFLDDANFPQAPETPTPTDGPAATPGPTPDAAESTALPRDEELTAVEGALPRLLWPQDDVTAADLTAFTGYLGEGTTTIVSSAAVGGRNAAHATAAGYDLLVTDTATSEVLSDVAAEESTVDRQRLLAEATARLQFAQARSAGAPLLIGLDRDETRSADALRDAISAADSLGFTLSSLRATPPVAATVTAEPDATRSAAVGTLLADEGRLTAFSSILEDPQVLLSPERIRILRTLAVGASASAFTESVADHQAQTRATLDAVNIPPSSTIQLLAANADLPIAVRNDLPWPVTVQLFVSPTDPRLDVKPMTETVVQPNSTTRVKVPVSARVGSGEVDLRLSLYSPTGVQIQGDQTIRVAVRAEWETIGLVIFGGLAVLLIALGVIRTIRRKRRETAVEEDDAVATVAEEKRD